MAFDVMATPNPYAVPPRIVYMHPMQVHGAPSIIRPSPPMYHGHVRQAPQLIRKDPSYTPAPHLIVHHSPMPMYHGHVRQAPQLIRKDKGQNQVPTSPDKGKGPKQVPTSPANPGPGMFWRKSDEEKDLDKIKTLGLLVKKTREAVKKAEIELYNAHPHPGNLPSTRMHLNPTVNSLPPASMLCVPTQ